MGLRKKKSRNPSRSFRMIVPLLLLCAGGAAFFLFFEGKAPTVDMSNLPEYLAKKDKFTVNVSDEGSGVRKIEVTATQGDISKILYSKEYPRKGYTGMIGPAGENPSVTFDSNKLGFKDGKISIEVTVSDFSLRGMLSGNTTKVMQQANLDTQPPRLRILHSEQYISPGGTGIAIFQNSDATSLHGIYINGNFNKGYPVSDGRKNTYISYFTLPYNTEKIDESRVFAQDIAGNIASVPFTMVLKKVAQKNDRINVGDGFLNKKIPEFEQYYPEMQGSSLEKYLTANNEIRQKNNKKISELSRNSSDEQLWEGRFLRMAGSSRAGFADHRTYYYEGKPIDKQVHLGVDIASTRHAQIKAANTGKVIFADYLGIYGNMIMLDHGQGVCSLYSHLSQINVAVDDVVAIDDVIGLSGTSGMAGGDHLHFSMVVNGVFATPKEWWDPHWIAVTIEEPLADSKF